MTSGSADRGEDGKTHLDVSFSRKPSRRPPPIKLGVEHSDEESASPICTRPRFVQKLGDEAEVAQDKGWAALSRRGKRRPNREDAFAAHACYIRTSVDTEPLSLFCVFDGHAGDRASKYARVRLPLLFKQNLEEDDSAEVVPALEKAFLTVHEELVQLNNPRSEVSSSLDDGVEGPDQDKGQLMRSWTAVPENSSSPESSGQCGTTATAVVIGRDELIVVYSGDSGAVGAMGADAIPTRLTDVHRPTREDESDRITDAGGVVLPVGGADRVNGVLAVSRSLGHDGDLGKLVIPNPEATCHELEEFSFLIIGTDGVWDFLCDQDAVNKAKRGLAEGGPTAATRMISDAAISNGSTDDITVLIIDMSYFGGAKHLGGGDMTLPGSFDDDFDNSAVMDREMSLDGSPHFETRNDSSVTGTPRHGAKKMMW